MCIRDSGHTLQETLKTDSCQQVSQKERTGIPHEDAGWMEIVPEEANGGSCDHCSQDTHVEPAQRQGYDRKRMALIPHTPAASPSMPSMKLTIFMMAITHSNDTGIAAQPKLKIPTKGIDRVSTMTPK